MKLNQKIKSFNYIRPEVELPAAVYNATLKAFEERDNNNTTRLVLDYEINNKLYRDSVTEDEIEVVSETGEINTYSPAGIFLEALAKQIKYDEITKNGDAESFLKYLVAQQVNFQVEVSYRTSSDGRTFRNIQVYRPKAKKAVEQQQLDTSEYEVVDVQLDF